MANHIQMVMYEGYLAAEPEMRYMPNGNAVTNFRIGSTSSYKNAAGEKIEETTWVKVTAWGKLGEIVNQYCGKASHVIVTGKLRVGENGSPSVYTKKDGGAAASYEVTASEIRILKGKSDSTPAPAMGDDEIPF